MLPIEAVGELGEIGQVIKSARDVQADFAAYERSVFDCLEMLFIVEAITPEEFQQGADKLAGVRELLERGRSNGRNLSQTALRNRRR